MDMIYTYGGGHVLYKIFNCVAAFCSSDSPYWSSFLAPAVLIGTLWGAAVATAKADIGIFAKKSFIPAYLLLTFLIVPKTSVWIKDQVDPTFGADKVDNLPVGLVIVAGASSLISSSIAELIEASFSTGDATNFTKTGLAFSSRLTQEARTIRISDITLRENVKDWCHQCVWLPYLKTNIKGKRDSAMKSEDLVGWVKSNGHPSLGVYWKTGGTKEYKTCKEAALIIQQALAVENDRGLSTLFARLFRFSSAQDTGEQLRPYMQDAWNRISKTTRTASQHIQQMLVVNALKESFDDNRSKAGYERLYPELVAINAARGLEIQNITGLIKGEAASMSLPLLQAFILGFLSVVFFIILPFCFIPGGLTLLSLWVKMMFSVQIWPVFSCILNALSQMWLERSTETVLQASKGFSIETTTGLTDAAFNVAAWSSGMQMLVPVLAWAFVSKSGYALTSVFQAATSTVEGNAARMASEAVDGNVSLGNQSILNTNMLGRSIAQQSHAGSHNFASSLNTGDEVLTNTLSGETIVQKNMSSLGTNLTSNDVANASMGDSLRDAQSLTSQNSKSFSKGLSNTSSEFLSLTEKLSNGSTFTKGVSMQDQASIQKVADETKGLMASLKESHGINANTTANAALSLGGKIAGLLGASGRISATAQDQEAIDKLQSTETGRKIVENIGKLAQFAEDHRGQIMDSTGKDIGEGFQNQYSKLQSSAETLNNSYTRSQNLENFKSYTESRSFGTSTNENDAWLDFVADKKGLSKPDAASFVDSGGREVQGLMGEFMFSRTTALRSFIQGADHVLSTSEIDGFLNKDMKVINSEGKDEMHTRISNAGLKTQREIDSEMTGLKIQKDFASHSNDSRFDTHNSQIDKKNQNFEDNFKAESEKTNIRKIGDKTFKDIKSNHGLRTG